MATIKTVRLISFYTLFSIGQLLLAQNISNQKLPTFGQVLDSMTVRFQQIRDYKVSIDVVMEVKGIHVPPMLATVYFKQPDNIHVDARGFAIFPKNAAITSPDQFRKIAPEGEVLAVEKIDDRESFHLRLSPELEDKNISVQIDLWIDRLNWILKKMRIESSQFGWFEIKNTFQLIDETFWLPRQSHVLMEVNREAMTRFRTQVPMNPESQFKRPAILNDLFGTGQMFISFRNYKVNSGLPDKIFEKEVKTNLK